jgi:hypothetical protein
MKITTYNQHCSAPILPSPGRFTATSLLGAWEPTLSCNHSSAVLGARVGFSFEPDLLPAVSEARLPPAPLDLGLKLLYVCRHALGLTPGHPAKRLFCWWKRRASARRHARPRKRALAPGSPHRGPRQAPFLACWGERPELKLPSAMAFFRRAEARRFHLPPPKRRNCRSLAALRDDKTLGLRTNGGRQSLLCDSASLRLSLPVLLCDSASLRWVWARPVPLNSSWVYAAFSALLSQFDFPPCLLCDSASLFWVWARRVPLAGVHRGGRYPGGSAHGTGK